MEFRKLVTITLYAKQKKRQFSLSCIGEGNGNPHQYSCLENSRDGGAWWTAVYGVAQSLTWLKQLAAAAFFIIQLLYLYMTTRNTIALRLLYPWILSVRLLEFIAILCSRGSPWPRDQTQVSCLASRFFTIWTTRETQDHINMQSKLIIHWRKNLIMHF